MALAGADNLICPYMADQFSLHGMKSLVTLLGAKGKHAFNSDAYLVEPFCVKAKENDVQLAKLKLVVLNRYRLKKGDKAVTFVDRQVEDAVKMLHEVYADAAFPGNAKLFADPIIASETDLKAIVNPNNDESETECKFKDEFFIRIHDMQTIAQISVTNCVPVSALEESQYHTEYGGTPVTCRFDNAVKAGIRFGDIYLRLRGVTENKRQEGFLGTTTIGKATSFSLLRGDETAPRKRLPFEQAHPKDAWRLTATEPEKIEFWAKDFPDYSGGESDVGDGSGDGSPKKRKRKGKSKSPHNKK